MEKSPLVLYPPLQSPCLQGSLIGHILTPAGKESYHCQMSHPRNILESRYVYLRLYSPLNQAHTQQAQPHWPLHLLCDACQWAHACTPCIQRCASERHWVLGQSTISHKVYATLVYRWRAIVYVQSSIPCKLPKAIRQASSLQHGFCLVLNGVVKLLSFPI
jgi:hypothetical protein